MFLLCWSLLLFVVHGDFLEAYLNDKVFGVDPGPCPFDEDDSCVIHLNATSFPPSIGEIEFCLLKDVPIVDSLFCQDLQDWVDTGTVELWDVQCQNVGIESVALEEVSRNNEVDKSSIVNAVTVTHLVQACTGMIRMTDVVLTIDNFRITLSYESEFSTSPDRDGLDVFFNLVFFANNTNPGSSFAF